MSYKIMNIVRDFTVCICCILYVSSCFRDDVYVPKTDVPENKVRLKLNTNVGGYGIPSGKTPGSRINTDEDIWVFVFEGAQMNTASFKEVVKAEVTEGEAFVTLTKSDATNFIAMIANTPNKFYNAVQDATVDFKTSNLVSALSGKTLLDTEDILLTELLAQPSVDYIPFHGAPVPMSGFAMVDNISGSTVVSNSGDGVFHLTRIVAKADVSSCADGFRLSGATAVNVPVGGTFFRQGSSLFDADNRLTDYVATSSEGLISSALLDGETGCYSTATTPLYVFESLVANGSSVIIKGIYENKDYYYNLGFIDASGEMLNIVRNKHYKFEISSVTGPGKATLEEAKAGASSNVNYHIVVVDDTSHDIVSNGRYYLGLSNSELVVYGDGALADILAFAVLTDASNASGISTNSISAVGQGLSVTGAGDGGGVNLASSPGVVGNTDVRIALSPDFVSGSVSIRLGDLSKTVMISRRPALSYSGVEAIDGRFVSGVISNKGDNEDWLSLSADGVIPSGDEFVLDIPGSVFIMAPLNVTESNGSTRRGGEFFLSRYTDEGRVKFVVSQACLNIGDIKIDPFGYVGAFWRKNQSGERLIRIPHIADTEGAWSAFVLSGDDWIVLDTEPSADSNVGWMAGSSESVVADMNTAENDSRFRVSGGSSSVSGSLQAGGHIYFRIGLKGSYTTSAESPARYGVVLLSYADNTKFSKIFVRQGEDADFLMSVNDVISAGNRNLAKKFAVFNLTHAKMTEGGSENHLHPHIDLRKGAFTDYPSQAGAFLQFANDNNQRFAYHPVNPVGAISGWQNNYASGFWSSTLIWSHETCPEGWRRPKDGSDNAAVPSGNNVAGSEMRQSLFLNPADGNGVSMDNALFGYYADGFFDRRKVVASPNGVASSAVSTGNFRVGYAGYLFFNPADNRSLFFPLPGRRSGSDGSLLSTGEYGGYWSVSSYTDAASAWGLVLGNQVRMNFMGKSEGISIRCVRNE